MKALIGLYRIIEAFLSKPVLDLGRKTFFLFASILVFFDQAHAFIPPPRMILVRTAENQGQGPVEVKLEVVISSQQDSLVVREVWQIENSATMKVAVVGQDALRELFRFDLLYRDGKKYWRTPSEGIKSMRLPNDFFENWFHARSSENLANLIIASNILPANFQNQKPFVQKKDKFVYEALDFLSLARVGGTVNYLFGRRLSGDGQSAPAVWIEQDLFRIRKIRFPSGATVRADQYANLKRNLDYPRQRVAVWENGSAHIRVLSGGDFKATGQTFSPNHLTPFSQWPDEVVNDRKASFKILREFYSRFR